MSKPHPISKSHNDNSDDEELDSPLSPSTPASTLQIKQSNSNTHSDEENGDVYDQDRVDHYDSRYEFKDDLTAGEMMNASKLLAKLSRDGSNYSDWSSKCIESFTILGMLVFTLDHRLTTKYRYSKKHACFLSMIRNALNEDVVSMFSKHTNAYDLWHELQRLYQPRSLLAKVSLIHDLAAMSRSYSGNGIDKHFGRLDTIFASLSKVGLVFDEETRSGFILSSFPSSFEHVLTALSVRESVTELVIRQHLSDYEKRTSLGRSSISVAQAAPVALSISHQQTRSQSECRNCGTRHHSSTRCSSRGSNFIAPPHHANQHRKKYEDHRPGSAASQQWRPNTQSNQTTENQTQFRSAHVAGSAPLVESTSLSENNSFLEEEELPVSDNFYDYSTFLNSSLPHSAGMAVLSGTAVSKDQPINKHIVILDSGASDHFLCNKELFSSFTSTQPKPIGVANGKVVHAIGEGTAVLKVIHDDKSFVVTLDNVLFVPVMPKSLISVGQLSDQFTIVFHRKVCSISINTADPFIIPISTSSNLFEAIIEPVKSCAFVAVDVNIAHKRLGHINMDYVRQVAKEQLGLSILPSSKPALCEGCMIGKSTKLSVPPKSSSRAPAPGVLLHADVCGDFSTISISRCAYFLIIVDDFSRSTFLFPLVNKSDATSRIVNTIEYIKTSIGTSVKVLRTDRGGEFSSNFLADFLASKGIVHQQPPAESSPQNGVSERAIRTVTSMTRAMLHSSGLPLFLWSEFALTAAYILNRSPLKAIGGKFPLQLWSGEKPDLSYLRAVGCVAFAHLTDRERDKIGAQAVECYLVGYEPHTKDAYRLWCVPKRSIIVSRDVRFVESIMYQDRATKSSVQLLDMASPRPEQVVAIQSTSSDATVTPLFTHEPNNASSPPNPVESINELSDAPPHLNQSESVGSLPSDLASRPHRTRKFTVPFWHMAQSAQLMLHDLGTDREPELSSFLATQAATVHFTPRTFKQAMTLPNHADWKVAFDAEIAAINKAGTWELVLLPSGRKALGTTWVCRVKTLANGSIDKLKCRLVAQGFSQVLGIDFVDTFAPVAKLATIRLLFAIAAALDLLIHHIDVDSAFLNGQLDEEVYVKQPEGYIVPGKEHFVCRLKKSLYGLKQAGKVWYDHLSKALIASDFRVSVADPCLFIKNLNSNDCPSVWVIVYVDDLAIISSCSLLISKVKQDLASHFSIKDLGPISSFLGIEIRRDSKSRALILSQRGYVDSIATQFECRSETSRTVSTPLPTGINLTDQEHLSAEPADREVYQSLLGSLMYLMLATRADISFAVTYLSQFSSSPNATQMKALRHLLRYVVSTADFSLVYSAGSPAIVVGMCDADFAANVFDRKSINGFVWLLSGAAITWNAKKQTLIALSTTEAEYVALVHAGREAIWIRSILSEVSLSPSRPTELYCDNLGAVALTANPGFHARTKHFDVKLHWIRDRIASSELCVHFVPTESNLADLFTKSLPARRHMALTQAIGLISI